MTDIKIEQPRKKYFRDYLKYKQIEAKVNFEYDSKIIDIDIKLRTVKAYKDPEYTKMLNRKKRQYIIQLEYSDNFELNEAKKNYDTSLEEYKNTLKSNDITDEDKQRIEDIDNSINYETEKRLLDIYLDEENLIKTKQTYYSALAQQEYVKGGRTAKYIQNEPYYKNEISLNKQNIQIQLDKLQQIKDLTDYKHFLTAKEQEEKRVRDDVKAKAKEATVSTVATVATVATVSTEAKKTEAKKGKTGIFWNKYNKYKQKYLLLKELNNLD